MAKTAAADLFNFVFYYTPYGDTVTEMVTYQLSDSLTLRLPRPIRLAQGYEFYCTVVDTATAGIISVFCEITEVYNP